MSVHTRDTRPDLDADGDDVDKKVPKCFIFCGYERT